MTATYSPALQGFESAIFGPCRDRLREDQYRNSADSLFWRTKRTRKFLMRAGPNFLQQGRFFYPLDIYFTLLQLIAS
jgi:hypothetical protein